MKWIYSYRYRHYNINFEFNNKLYKHLYNYINKFNKLIILEIINFEILENFLEIIIMKIKVFHILKILFSNIINIIIEKFIFWEYRFITILIIFLLIKKGYKLYFNIEYIINFIDKKFLLKISLKIVIKKILSSIII